MAPRQSVKDDAVLCGPKSPTWSCGCGQSCNFASRIRCRGCNRDAPGRIRAAAEKAHKQAATAPKVQSHQLPRGAWKNGAPDDGRLRKLEARLKSLEAENKTLRDLGECEKLRETVDDDEGEQLADTSADPLLLQAVLDATVKTYGPDSEQAKEKTRELEAARHARRQARPASVQMRAAERRVFQQRKAVEKAEAKAASTAEELCKAQAASVEALQKVAAAKQRLQDAEAEQLACCLPAAAASPRGSANDAARVSALETLLPALAGDTETMQALEFPRTKLAARPAPSQANEAAAISAGHADAAVEDAAEAMELDDEAIDGMFALLEETPEGSNAEQHALFLAATKASCKAKRRDVASQISLVRKRLKK